MSEENSNFAKPPMSGEAYEAVQELFQLVRSGDAVRLENLFNLGFDAPNIRDGKGNTLLMLASYNGQLEVSRVLLEKGADPQIANDMGQIPLAGAAFKGNAVMTRLLLKHGANANAQMADGKTALMFAAMFNQIEIIDILVEHGADISLQSADGATAKSMAQMMGADAAREHLEKLSENKT